MIISKDCLYVSLVGKELEHSFFEKKLSYNAELAFFALKDVVAGNVDGTAAKVKKVLEENKVKFSIHGPFMELMYDSRDLDVVKLAEQKVMNGLKVAEFLGAEHIVFHSTYNPLSQVANSKFDMFWVKKSAEFWKKIIDSCKDFSGMILIENIFDDSPEPIKKLIAEVNNPMFKVCLDVGHANIYGKKYLIDEWVEGFGEDLKHLHVHDNHGGEDEHLGVGAGNIDFEAFFNALDNLNECPPFVLEVRGEDELERSLKYLRDNNLL